MNISPLPHLTIFRGAWDVIIHNSNIKPPWYVRLLPESPRWLLLKGREAEARKILSRVAKWNKRPLPDVLVLQKPAIPENRITFRQLFGTWKTAKKTLISWDLW